MEHYEGSCGCGAIHYVFQDKPINSAFCYCKECQIRTGSDKWFGLWVPKAKLSFTKDTPVSFTRVSDAGNNVHMLFCGRCGTTLCGEVEAKGIYSVSVATLNNGHDMSPNMAIFTASAPDWALFPEGVPKFDTLPGH